MRMEEISILTDCVESLEHAAEAYMQAAFSCDTGAVRKRLQQIAHDRCEQQAAVFNLMHQMGIYKTEPAPADRLEAVKSRFLRALGAMERRREAAGEGREAGHEQR